MGDCSCVILPDLSLLGAEVLIYPELAESLSLIARNDVEMPPYVATPPEPEPDMGHLFAHSGNLFGDKRRSIVARVNVGSPWSLGTARSDLFLCVTPRDAFAPLFENSRLVQTVSRLETTKLARSKELT